MRRTLDEVDQNDLATNITRIGPQVGDGSQVSWSAVCGVTIVPGKSRRPM